MDVSLKLLCPKASSAESAEKPGRTQVCRLVGVVLFARLAAIALMSCLALSVSANDESFQVTGFGTLAVTKAGTDEFGFINDYVRPAQNGEWELTTDSMLGLQVNWEMSSKLESVVQLVATNRFDNGLNDVVDWAFIGYRMTPDLDIRVGRLTLDLHGLSEYRNVGFAYQWARPINEFYAPLVTNRLDGIDVQYRRRFGPGVAQYKLFVGSAAGDVKTKDVEFEFRLTPVVGLKLDYAIGNLTTRLTIATSQIGSITSPVQELADGLAAISVEDWPAAMEIASQFQAKSQRISYYSAGTQYEIGSWDFKSEISYTESKYKLSPSSRAWYLSAARKLSSTVSAYGVYSSLDTIGREIVVGEPNNQALIPFQQLTEQILNSNRWDQHTFSVGVRWNLRPKAALKFQWDQSHIAAGGGGLWETTLLQTNRAAVLDSFYIGLDFVF